MFIRIKAQSSDLENQYIKERDIFKKKSKGPKLLLSGLLIATVGGYFYYLNSGNPLQINKTSVAIAETEQNVATVENSVTGTETESENQSKLFSEVLASDVSEQLEPAEGSTNIIIGDLTEDSISSRDTNETLAEASIDVANITEDSSPEDVIADMNAYTAEQETEDLAAASTNVDIENEIDTDELAQEEQIEAAETDDLIAGDSENISASITDDLEEPTITEADSTEIEARKSIVENSSEIQTTEEILENLQSNSIESKLGSNDDASELREEIEIIKVTDEQSQAVEAAVTEITLESPKNERISTLVADLEITDQSIAAIEPAPETASTSTIGRVKESRPIKAISNMISSVFARDDEQERIAEVIESDFSKASNPEHGQEHIGIITDTDSDKSDAYQGSSIEELAQPNYETIDTAALDGEKVTTFEVSENEVNEIIEKEKQHDTPSDSSSASESIDSLFEGIDSVAAVSDSDITSLPIKSQTPETTPAESEQRKIDKKQKKSLSGATDVVKVETVEAAKLQPKKIEKTNQQTTSGNKTDTTTAAISTEIEATINKNKSTITIKDLYDQLMTDLDQKETVSVSNEPTTDKNNKKITVKQLYEQITNSANVEQAAVAIKQTENITTLPSREKNADVELKIDPDKSLAMVDPVDSNITENEEILIKNEIAIKTASVNTQQLTDNKGSTPLMIAALNADLQTVRELVQQGAQINKRNDWGWTALLNATIKGNQPLVKYLLKNGASPHLADKDGRSPLMAAVHNNHPEIVKTLLNNSADVNKANRDGWTALSFAAWKGNVSSVKYLLQANAFKNHRTSEGLTPLQLAEQGDHTEVINLLSL